MVCCTHSDTAKCFWEPTFIVLTRYYRLLLLRMCPGSIMRGREQPGEERKSWWSAPPADSSSPASDRFGFECGTIGRKWVGDKNAVGNQRRPWYPTFESPYLVVYLCSFVANSGTIVTYVRGQSAKRYGRKEGTNTVGDGRWSRESESLGSIDFDELAAEAERSTSLAESLLMSKVSESTRHDHC